jgi:flavin reductase (DIM6/NTAB) family NADH-FMN oxidoreductase RutF
VADRIDSAAFRDALARFASGVTVITAAGPSGPLGFTATGFTSVSLSPPLVLMCAGKSASVHDGVISADRFGVSILSEHQRWIAEQFARSGVDRFRDVALRMEGVPLIEGAVAQLGCRRHALHDAGDHTIVIGEVLETFVGGGRPLLHWTRRFGAFVAESGPQGTTPLAPRQGGHA